MSPHQHHLELARRYLDGTATAEETGALESLLRTDAVFRRQFLRYANVDAALGGGRLLAAPAAIPRQPPHHSLWFSWRPLAAAAALMLLAGLAIWFGVGPSRHAVAMEIIASEMAPQFVAGQRVALRRLVLESGSVRFRLDSGAVVAVTGPAELQLLDAMHLRVRRGRVTADVGDHAKGFVVETAQARVVDLGTKFGVDVADSGHTDVVVFQGEVELFDHKAGHAAPMARLIEGEAVRVDARQQMSRIVNVTSTASTSEWSTRAGDDASVIASVRDNLRDAGAKNYYRIISGGLHEDARAFVGQRHEWNGLTVAGMPAELLGADLVQTFVKDRAKVALEITVTVSRPSVLYVLFDSRSATPAWLTETFTDTGARIGLENAPQLDSGHAVGIGPGAGNMAPFAVWKRVLPRPGSITLGPPRDTPDQRLLWMYGIAGKAL